MLKSNMAVKYNMLFATFSSFLLTTNSSVSKQISEHVNTTDPSITGRFIVGSNINPEIAVKPINEAYMHINISNLLKWILKQITNEIKAINNMLHNIVKVVRRKAVRYIFYNKFSVFICKKLS